MSEEPETKSPSRRGSTLASAGTFGTRVWDFISRLATLTKEQERHSRQLETFSEHLLTLTRAVERMVGRAESIEKRFDDKDRMVEALIALRVKEEADKLRTEFKGEIERLRAELKKLGGAAISPMPSPTGNFPACCKPKHPRRPDPLP